MRRDLPDRADEALAKGVFFLLRSSVPRWNMYLLFTFLGPWLDFSCPSASLAGSTVSICSSASASRAPLIHCHMYMISLSGQVTISVSMERKRLADAISEKHSQQHLVFPFWKKGTPIL